MQFNKLYNLILQSILTQNKATRAQMLANVDKHQQIEKYLNTLDNKVADFLAKFFKSGQLKDTTDKRIQHVIDILQRNTNFNTQINITLADFLKQNETYLNRSEVKKNDYLDNIPQFSQKKEYPKGVVIYKVADTKEGQAAVRKIINAQWGENTNPWCLTQSKHDGVCTNVSWNYWKKYSAFPKHIAFQNGKLIGFCADSSGNCTWWDKGNKHSDKLKLLDGSFMQTEKYEFDDETRREMFINKFNLKINKQTGRYDGRKRIWLKDQDLLNGHLPVKLGKLSNTLMIDTDQLKSLDEFPLQAREVSVWLTDRWDQPQLSNEEKRKLFLLVHKDKLTLDKKTGLYNSDTSIEILNGNILDGHLPIKFGKIEGCFWCKYCRNLTSLEGMPTEVTGKEDYCGSINLPAEFRIKKYIKRQGLIYNPKTKLYDAKPSYAIHVYNGDIIDGHFPVKFGVIEGRFDCSDCKSLKTLEGAPRKVTETFECSDCQSLKSLQGGPEYVGGEYYIPDCSKIKNLIGMPKKINSLNASYVPFQSLEGCPEEIEDGVGFNCRKLTSFKYFPKKIGGDLYLSSVPNRLKSELETVLKNTEIGGESYINYERV